MPGARTQPGDQGTVARFTGHGPVEVVLSPGPARGQTLVDRRTRPGESELHGDAREQPLVDVALEVDVERYVALYLEAVGKA